MVKRILLYNDPINKPICCIYILKEDENNHNLYTIKYTHSDELFKKSDEDILLFKCYLYLHKLEFEHLVSRILYLLDSYMPYPNYCFATLQQITNTILDVIKYETTENIIHFKLFTIILSYSDENIDYIIEQIDSGIKMSKLISIMKKIDENQIVSH